jgi:hypothetical protein
MEKEEERRRGTPVTQGVSPLHSPSKGKGENPKKGEGAIIPFFFHRPPPPDRVIASAFPHLFFYSLSPFPFIFHRRVVCRSIYIYALYIVRVCELDIVRPETNFPTQILIFVQEAVFYQRREGIIGGGGYSVKVQVKEKNKNKKKGE